MFERGADFLDYVGGRRPWGQLVRLLDGLPRHSAYKAALDSDETVASIALSLTPKSARREESEPHIPLAGYDPAVQRLDNVFDAVNALSELVRQALSRGKKHIDPVRATRPETAVQKLQKQETKQGLYEMESKLLGG